MTILKKYWVTSHNMFNKDDIYEDLVYAFDSTDAYHTWLQKYEDLYDFPVIVDLIEEF